MIELFVGQGATPQQAAQDAQALARRWRGQAGAVGIAGAHATVPAYCEDLPSGPAWLCTLTVWWRITS